MAAAPILTTASTAADSSDVIVVAGTPLAVSLKGVADGGARVVVSLKDDAGAYNVVSELTSHQPKTLITAPGAYRFTRVAGAACGVFSA